MTEYSGRLVFRAETCRLSFEVELIDPSAHSICFAGFPDRGWAALAGSDVMEQSSGVLSLPTASDRESWQRLSRSSHIPRSSSAEDVIGTADWDELTEVMIYRRRL